MDTDEYNRRIQEWAKTKWTQPHTCPLCRTADWQANPPAETPLRRDVDEEIWYGKAIPVVPLTCKNCGYTLFISALVAGVLDQRPEADADPTPAVDTPDTGITGS